VADKGQAAGILCTWVRSVAERHHQWFGAPLGLNLNNNALRIAIGLRLGVPLVMPHQCPCGAAVNKLGHHGLACKRSRGRQLRHNLLNDGILRTLQSAGVQAVRDPPGLDRSGGKRQNPGPLDLWLLLP